jgi:YD repeat-containing protein
MQMVIGKMPSRLLVLFLPKSNGVCTENYDANCNLLSKTDNKAVVTTYRYDPLNRTMSKSYSDTVTPPVTMSYDTAGSCLGSISSYNTGRLVSVSTTAAGTVRIRQLPGRIRNPVQKNIGSHYTSAAFKPGTATVLLNKLGIALTFLLCSACARKTDLVRPEGVSLQATYVAGGELGGWWQECTRANTSPAVHCRIWNGAGLVLADEEFLPYDGGAPPSADERKVSTDPGVPGGPDRVFLSNRRVLLPRSRFDELRSFVDWLFGKAPHPR